MTLGILQFDLHIHDARSLKDKRRVVLSLKDRLHREHRCAIAEVALQERMSVARLALVIVGSDGRHMGQSLDAITTKIRALAGPEAELGDVSRQVVHAEQLPDGEAQDDQDDQARDAREQALDAALARELLQRGLNAEHHRATSDGPE